MICWALGRSKLWLISLLAILLGVQHIGSYVTASLDFSDPEDLSIMSYNVGGAFSGTYKKSNTAHKEIFTDLIQEESKPSILCLQESGYTNKYLKKLYYKSLHRVGSLMILSDYEIQDKGRINFEDTYNRVIWADLIIKGSPVRIVNMHLQSNKVSEQTKDLVNNPDLAEKKTWLGMRSVIAKIKRATELRTYQALEAKKFIDSSPYPTLVVGDFNDTPLSYTYRQLAKNYQDGFIRKGKGLGITYAGNIPGLRIDYILGSKDIKFTNYSSSKSDLSDHYPIICQFDFEVKSEN